MHKPVNLRSRIYDVMVPCNIMLIGATCGGERSMIDAYFRREIGDLTSPSFLTFEVIERYRR
jgi:hypothetical protein